MRLNIQNFPKNKQFYHFLVILDKKKNFLIKNKIRPSLKNI